MQQKKTVLFFADGSQDLGGLSNEILNQQTKSGLLSIFLRESLNALQGEWNSLSALNRRHIPPFLELRCLFQRDDLGRRHTSLHSAEVVLVQLAYFIAMYEQHPQIPYPNKDNSIIIGVCYGELAAAAVSLASSLHGLIPFAVDAVKLAFRGGILTTARGNELECVSVVEASWSASVSKDTGLHTAEGLANFHEKKMIAPARQAWISTYGNESIVLSGPPSTLDQLSDYLASHTQSTVTSIRRISTSTPCHAPHLYSREETMRLLEEPQPLKSLFVERNLDNRHSTTLIPGTGMEPLEVTSGIELFGTVIHNVLAQPIQWTGTILSCQETLRCHDLSATSLQVFGPDLMGRRFASHLGIPFSRVSLATSLPNQGSQPPIAIIGMSGRFPSAENTDEFWNLLKRGVDTSEKVPQTRFDSKGHFDQEVYGCFLQNPGLFDPSFFHLSPREAIEIDPSQRLALTTTEEALSSAGFVPNKSVSTQLSRVGVFWGLAESEYKEISLGQKISPYHMTGTLRSFGPGRISYYRKFDGPSMCIDSACSSSMVALNQACLAIWNGDCETAVVGGSSIITSRDNYKGLTAARFLSPTGQCKTFDMEADGYCRGEAVASVVVKSLDQAIIDNDNILGIIKAISTNHSSAARSLTRPHGPTQETLFRRVLHQAALTPSDIDYVEMHGTGTQVGDSEEMSSVISVFSSKTTDRLSPLYIGAVKSNIGHGEAASGITSLVKCLLMLREKEIPPHIGVQPGKIRNEAELAAANIRIPSALTDWIPSEVGENSPRRILLNNFSAAGGNTTLILEKADFTPQRDEISTRKCYYFPFSAKTSESLGTYMRRFLIWIKQNSSLSLADISYSLTARRIHHARREAFIASSIEDLCQQLELATPLADPRNNLKAPQTVFIFTGYSENHLLRNREFFEVSSLFRDEVYRLDQTAQRLGFEAVLPLFIDADTSTASLVQKQLTHVISQICMYMLLRSLSVRPSMVLGHSLGEFSALSASGMISPSDAIYLVGSRAKALEKKCDLKSHSMLAVHCSTRDFEVLVQSCPNGIEIACENGPRDIVLAGSVSALAKVKKLLDQSNIRSSHLRSPLAFHSSQMDAIMNDMADISRVVKLSDPEIPFLCPLKNQIIAKANQLGSDYFQLQTRQTVRFEQVLSTASCAELVDDSTVWLELGQHAICSRMVKSVFGPDIRSVSLMENNKVVDYTLARVLDLLYKAGVDIHWEEYFRDRDTLPKLLTLPSYAFEEQNYWKQRGSLISTKHSSLTGSHEDINGHITLSKTVHTLKSKAFEDGRLILTFETDHMGEEFCNVASGHIVNGARLCPASILADMAFTIAKYLRDLDLKLNESLRPILEDVEIVKPILIPSVRPPSSPKLYVIAHCDTSNGSTRLRFETSTRAGERPILYASCNLRFEMPKTWQLQWHNEQDTIVQETTQLESNLLKGSCQRIFHQAIYKLFDDTVVYEKRFKSMNELLVDLKLYRASALLDLYDGPECEGYYCCPFWMDGFFHVAGFVVNGLMRPSDDMMYICPGWKSFRMAKDVDPRKQYRIFVRIEDVQSPILTASCYVLEGNNIVGEIEALKFHRISKAVLDRAMPRTQPNPRRTASAPDESLPLRSTVSKGSHHGTRSDTSEAKINASSSLNSRLLDILSQETGLPVSSIGSNTRLSDLGIDSILSFVILSKINETFDLSMPASLLEIEMTVSMLHAHIANIAGSEGGFLSGVSRSIMSAETSASTLKGPRECVNTSRDVAHGSEIRMVIQQLIAEQLEVTEDIIAASGNLADLGMDSIASMQLADTLTQTFRLPSDFSFPLVGTSVAEIEQTISTTLSLLADKPTAAICSPKKFYHPLSVCIQGVNKDHGKTLFLFPDGSGSAAVYSRLSFADHELRIQAFNSPYLNSETSFDISDLMQVWVAEIKRQQPTGPYHLGGWSSGGYFAYEASKILLESGESVETLICIDTPSLTEHEAMPEDVLEVLAKSGIMGPQGTAAPQWLVDHFRSTVRALSRYTPAPMAGSKPGRTCLIWAAEGTKILDNKLTSSAGFESRIAQFFMSDAGTGQVYGWDALIDATSLRTAITPGTHFSLIHPPNVQHLSKTLEAALSGNDSLDTAMRISDYR